jgi:antitoxin ParD1/3/4
MTMNVSLTPELEKFVDEKVKSGLYNSASEVVRESLRLLRREDEIEQLQLEELRREIKSSIKQMDDGQGVPLDVVRERLQQRRAKKR